MGFFGGLIAVVVWLYTVGVFVGVLAFMGNVGPYKIDGEVEGSLVKRLAIDVGMAAFFFVPHSIFCRPAIKKPLGETNTNLYRTAYVAHSSFALTLIVMHWQPVWKEIVIWDLGDSALATTSLVILVTAWLWAVSATFATDHFEFFGVVQGSGGALDPMKMIGLKADNLLTAGTKDPTKPESGQTLTVRMHYQLCRHPVLFGFLIVFWAGPTMTVNHAFFSATCSLYVFVTVPLQEMDIVAEWPKYAEYQKEMPMFCPIGCCFKKAPSAGKVELIPNSAA